ncbi:MAG TPA: hypothetical protein VHL98_06335 [Microvirga sp.]|jgi:chromosome segregation ATPase|nr:hypothetical protein [Microvirga sp.]
MTAPQDTKRLNGHIAGSLLFLALAFAGWGALLWNLRDSAETRAQLAAQVERLEADLGQVSAERDQWRAAGERQREIERELVDLRTQLQAARAETAALRQSEEQRVAELRTARQEAASLAEQLEQANARVSQTGGVARSQRGPRRRPSR